MNARNFRRFTPPIPEAGCLKMINSQRKTIANRLNELCRNTMALDEGHIQEARAYFEEMCGLIDVSAMLDVITDEEHSTFYENTHMFFSGLPIPEFELNDLEHHHFEEYTVLDCVLVYKINIQERLNEALKNYREFNENVIGLDKSGYIRACENMVHFGKMFAILKEDEQEKALKIIHQHKNNAIKEHKIIFVPEAFYEKIEN